MTVDERLQLLSGCKGLVLRVTIKTKTNCAEVIMYVLGTAGHVDHGKSALVYALTSIDPDRLPEEKAREMTIDLGFAWMALPSGREVSIVDVPGHERFINNMLAGVGGIDLALLIIAADEGVMPQTREHLAILDLLNVDKGIVVITKKDMVDDEMLELVTLDAEEVIEGTALAGAPIVITSAVTREGLDDLLTKVDSLLDSCSLRRDIGKPRLSIDRVFTMKGFGTVVTGTLMDGKFDVGQEVEILPIGQRTNVRGLQVHKQKIKTALPGSRVAVNLTGVAVEDISRGFVLTTPGWLKPSRFVDVNLRAVSDLGRPIRHNASVTFHTGASEVAGKVRLLDKDTIMAGESGWAQVLMRRPVVVAKGDLFIIRSSRGTLGGGQIVDSQGRRHRRFQTSLIESLETREKGSADEVFMATLQANEPNEFGKILPMCGLSQEEAEKTLRELIAQGQVVSLGTAESRALLYSEAGWRRFSEEAKRVAQDYLTQFSLRKGMPREDFRSKLKIPSQHFGKALERLVDEGEFVEDRALVKLASREINLSARQQQDVDTYLKALAKGRYSPPNEEMVEAELLNMLIEERRVVKVKDNIFYLAEVYDEMITRIVDHMKANGNITVSRMRDMFDTSRKYALAFMEHLDEQKITRRVGDERVLR